MKQIGLVLQNDGVKRNVIFPCTESEYQTTCKELELKDNYAFVRDVVEPKALALKKDTFVNLDEINYLAKRMDSFDQKELFSFFAAVEAGDYVSTKDLINLTFNQTCYTLIRDVSNLKNIGYNRVLSSRGCIGVDELEKMDLEKIGRELLSTGKGIPTKYGLLFRNENVVFEEVYKGRGFPPYYYTGGEVLGVEIEKDGEKDYIYFPCEKTEIERALKRIGAGDISECSKNIDYCCGDEEWEDYFNDLLQKNDLESVNAISSAINRLGATEDAIWENLYKLSAVMEFAGVTSAETEKIIRLAQSLDDFEYYREIGNDYNLGTKLIENEIGEAAEKIDDYIDYEKYAQDFLEENGGAYIKSAEIIKRREDSLKMSEFVYFTPQEKEAARNADIAEMLERQGERLKRSGSEYEWGEGSERVTIRGNLWYHQYEQKGGNAVSFVQKFMDKTYVEAMKFILGDGAGEVKQAEPKQAKAKEKRQFEPPALAEEPRKAYAYLNVRRGIPKDVLVPFFKKKLIGETKKYANVAFMGYDTNGNLKHVNLRTTYANSTFKGNAPGCTPEYSFHYAGQGEKLYLFEAPIDMLSFIAMKGGGWQDHSYAACCGVSDKVLFQTLKDNPNIKKVFLCLDNDWAGRVAEYRIAEKLKENGLEFNIKIPKGKDWNEDLLTAKEQAILRNTEVNECRGLQYS